jgi:hypothetical protein
VHGKVLSKGIFITLGVNRPAWGKQRQKLQALSMITSSIEYSHNDESIINSTRAGYLEILQRFVRRSFEWKKLLKLANIQNDQRRQTLAGIISYFSRDTSLLVTQ